MKFNTLMNKLAAYSDIAPIQFAIGIIFGGILYQQFYNNSVVVTGVNLNNEIQVNKVESFDNPDKLGNCCFVSNFHCEISIKTETNLINQRQTCFHEMTHLLMHNAFLCSRDIADDDLHQEIVARSMAEIMLGHNDPDDPIYSDESGLKEHAIHFAVLRQSAILRDRDAVAYDITLTDGEIPDKVLHKCEEIVKGFIYIYKDTDIWKFIFKTVNNL